MDRYSYSMFETDSSYVSTASFSSSSTIPGLGYLSGKAIKRLGTSVIKGVDAIIIRRRLAHIENVLKHKHFAKTIVGDTSPAMRSLYFDLLELYRSIYGQSIRTRAFRLIMGEVGGLHFQDLAAAVVDWPTSETYHLILEMLICFRSLIHSHSISAPLSAHLSEGLNAYKAAVPPGHSAFTGFMLFLGMVTTLSRNAVFARMLIELDILELVIHSYPTILDFKVKLNWPKELLSVQLVLHALLQKLDLARDSLHAIKIYRLLYVTAHSDAVILTTLLASQSILPSSPELLESIKSTVNEITMDMNASSSRDHFKRTVMPGISISSVASQLDKARNDEIDAQLNLDRLETRNELQFLFMGTGNSGKDSVSKKMKEFQHLKILREGGYTMQEREFYKDIIRKNLVQSMRAILDGLPDLDLSVAAENTAHLSTVFALPSNLELNFLTRDISNALRSLSKDPAIIEAIRRSKELHLNDSVVYYLNSAERLSSSDYIPSDQDILRRLEKDPAVTEIILGSGELKFKLYHVASQRSEWKKWMHLFESVAALVFLVDISDYDQMYYKDESVNCMQEAFSYFDEICNSKWFSNTSIILFLNGIEVFAEKLAKSPLDDYFPDYTGGDNYDAACEYLLHRFVSLNRSAAAIRHIYAHYLPEAVGYEDSAFNFILSAAPDIALQVHLRSIG
ncbi:hypothetical protein GYMLUDRAFT_88289 [Collybiopsis luxurians FD-317 M1]|uniref:Guanine nucleotide-binding protein subunit alpha n=1 Tax=Collybiopsis luxurians FD-317 M1 TaxID=944289 RepID=A0A0D0C7Q4_9AGAR|nr:hypothetical protein GYMLUDRAFT_88289 [Collybiopsis luxurians FD-317 M1]